MKDKYKGIFLIILSAFCFALMNMFVRLAGDLPSIQKSFFRNFIAAICAAFMLMKSGTSFRWNRGNLPDLLVRAVAGTVGILCNFYAVDHLVLSDASMLNKMSPFFVIVFSIFILKERVTPVQVLCVTGAFLGSLLVIKPTFANADLFASVLGFIGGLGAGLAYTFVRKLGTKGENGNRIVFFFSAFSCLVTLPFLVFDYHSMSIYQIGILLLAGLSAAGGQFSITAAYTYAPGREISVYDYSQIVFSALLGYIMFSQIPDIWSIAGYIIICLMAVLMFLYNNRRIVQEQNC